MLASRGRGTQRQWKNQLIESANPDWRDLYPDII
jgi:predicted GIY-YIG superfamily endonuclease